MTEFNQATNTEQFLSSKQSQAAKARPWLYGSVLLGFLISGAGRGFGWNTFIGSSAVLALIFVFDWFILRPAARPGQLVVGINNLGISSPRFNTKAKFYAWSDILEANVESVQGVVALQIRLNTSKERRDARSYINGVNPARPFIPLAALLPLEQECLLGVIHGYLNGRNIASFNNSPNNSAVNTLREERLFQESLVALAPLTWVTYGLIGMNVAIWVAMVASGAGLLQGRSDILLDWGGNSAYLVQQGEWWRLLSAAFLHSGVLHLLMNMIGLWATGVTVERIYGHKFFLLIYLGAGLLGSAASLHFSAQKAVSVGASGAVFGVAGALLVAVLQHRKELPKMFGKQAVSGMSVFILYSLVQGLGTPGIDNAAHVGGLIAGVALAVILPRRFNQAQFDRTAAVRGMLALGTLGLAVWFVVVQTPKGATDLRALAHAGIAFERGVKAFDTAIRAL